MPRVAIVRNGWDIGRLIAREATDSSCDFKLNLLDNEYDVYLVRLFEEPKSFPLPKSNQWEITYHRSQPRKPPVVHLKHKSKDQPDRYAAVDRTYVTLPLERLLEPTVISEFPIPLMRIAVTDGACHSLYAHNPKEHRVLDMSEANVAEIYLASKSFDFGRFDEKWPCLSSMVLLSHAIEYFATGNLRYTSHKLERLLPQGDEERTFALELEMTDDVLLYVSVYNDPGMSRSGSNISVTFIENAMYFAFLASIIMRFPEPDGTMSASVSAFERDLLYGRHFELLEKEKWRYRFRKWLEVLEREEEKHRSCR